MAHFLFVTWDGGGNVSVALGIGDALLARGHAVTILAPPSLEATIEALGFGYRELGIAPPTDPKARAEYLVEVVGSTTAPAELQRYIDELRPDGLVIDCNLSWAIDMRTTVPTTVLVHTAIGLYLSAWQAVIDEANAGRAARRLRTYSPAVDAWSSHQLLLIASVAAFDRPPVPLPSNGHYVGWVRDPHRSEIAAATGVDVRSHPVVLVSYSTDRLQNNPERVQSALDALAELPVHVVGTTSGTFATDQLSVPDNAVVMEYLSHDQWMPKASVVIAHAGHGTTMAALYHAVPMICIPALGRDQLPIAARVVELGLGLALASDATSTDLRAAVTHILRNGAYRVRAQRFAGLCRGLDGAAAAAAKLEETIATS